MFTGIIESIGIIENIDVNGTNRIFRVSSSLAPLLKVDQSLSHNGVCLTVESVQSNSYQVTAINETLSKTNLSAWKTGTKINLERCLQMNGRIDGHIVQGHVDTTAKCLEVTEKNGSWEFTFGTDPSFKGLMVEKGSISVNGISLTIFNVTETTFTVAIIPYTYHHTNMHDLKKNDIVNLEFDMIGKYVQKAIAVNLGSK